MRASGESAGHGAGSTGASQPGYYPAAQPILAGAPFADFDRFSQAIGDRLFDDNLALLRHLLQHRHAGDCIARQHVDLLDRIDAHGEAPRRADGDCYFDVKGNRRAARRLQIGIRPHHVLHRQAAGDGPSPVVSVQPAGDGVAGKADHRAAVAIQLDDQRIENGVEKDQHLFGAALRAELLSQCSGERRKARNIGE